MRRFLFLTFCGGVSALGGHAFLSLGLYPGRLVPLAAVLEGCIALAVGTALFVTGMLGLADAYERQSRRLAALLQRKEPPPGDPAGDDTAVADPPALQASDERFWRGYTSTAGGLIIILGGLLALVIALGKIPYEAFRLTMGAGIAGIALPAMILWVRGFVRIRRSHVVVAAAAQRFEACPDRRITPPAQTFLQPRRGAVFRRSRPPSHDRDLTRRSGRRPVVPPPAGRRRLPN